MSFAPWVPKNDIEVLEGHPDRYKTSLPRRLYYPGMVGASLLTASLLANLVRRRPLLASLPLHAAALTIGLVCGETFRRRREIMFMETDARLRYYVETHKDDFPDYEMIKVGEILEPWTPNR